MKHSRRHFIRTTGRWIAGTSLAPTVLPGIAHGYPANNKLNVALIGCRGMGMYNLTDHLREPGIECAALCDVDNNVLEERAAKIEALTGKRPRRYGDYREVIDDKDIDIVIIGTPDHWHCLPAVEACAAGKDVYVEKPLANSIAECQVMLAAARKHNRVVQVGQQQRSGQHWQDVIDFVRAGKLGAIRHIRAWGFFDYGKGNPRVPHTPAPEGVDYDTWLGPAPEHPFNQNRFHGTWRHFWDHGGGLLTDWGVHLLDIPLWAMGVRFPKSVSASGGIYAYTDNAIETPDTLHVLYDYGDFTLAWDHAGGLARGHYGRHYGIAFVGNNGTLVVNREGWEVIAEPQGEGTRMNAVPLQPADKEDHIKHVRNFIAAVRSRERPICDVEAGHDAAIIAHMGNIAYRTGTQLRWNESAGRFDDNAEANALLKPAYRAPWKFPRV